MRGHIHAFCGSVDIIVDVIHAAAHDLARELIRGFGDLQTIRTGLGKEFIATQSIGYKGGDELIVFFTEDAHNGQWHGNFGNAVVNHAIRPLAIVILFAATHRGHKHGEEMPNQDRSVRNITP